MAVILAVVSFFCFFYYLVIIWYAGTGTAFSTFWLAAGSLFLVSAGLRIYSLRKPGGFTIPLWLKVSLMTTIGAAVLLFTVIELLVFTNMFSEQEEDLEYIIVLGARVKGDTPSNELIRRLDRALEYLNDHEDTIVIVSGGQGPGENLTEAEAMRMYLVEKGISRVRIRQEVRSVNTTENLKLSKFYTKESSSVGILTSDFHIFRAKAIGEHLGYKGIVGIPAPSNKVFRFHYMVREAFAVLKDKFMGNI